MQLQLVLIEASCKAEKQPLKMFLLALKAIPNCFLRYQKIFHAAKLLPFAKAARVAEIYLQQQSAARKNMAGSCFISKYAL
jgi:hypothetical protein